MEFFSPGHLIVLAIVVAILFFGWKQLPDMSRSLGRSLRVFKTEIKGMSEDDKEREAAQAAKTAVAEQQPALEAAPVRAEIVKNVVKTPQAPPVAAPPAAARPTPRPSPRPNAASANGTSPNGRTHA